MQTDKKYNLYLNVIYRRRQVEQGINLCISTPKYYKIC